MPSSPRRVPSRLMPLQPEPDPNPMGHILGTLVLLAMAVGLLVALTELVLAGWPLILLLIAMFVDSRMLAEPTATDRSSRANATICHFARAFERRTVDTWILRACYERLTATSGAPIRADDALEELGIDIEELDFEILEVADRCGRSLEAPAANPYVNFTTVRNLVLFLNHQPMLPATRALRGLPA